MLTSFFRKSKPITFFLILILTFFVYILFNFTAVEQEINGFYILKKTGLFFIVLLSLIFVNYILIKEKSKSRHAFVLYLYFLFIVATPNFLQNGNMIMAGFFLILGFRRTLLFHTGKHLSKKIFDAFFWFALGSLFFPPALFFLIIPLFGIFYFAFENYKHWLIPLVALSSVFIIKTTYDLITQDAFFNPLEFYLFKNINADLNNFPINTWFPALLVLFAVWILLNMLLGPTSFKQKLKREKIILFISFLVGLTALYFSGNSSTPLQTSYICLYIPTALISGRYYEKQSQKLLKEILLITLSFLSLFFLITQQWNLI